MTTSNESPAGRFNELPIATQEFLSQLEKEDIALMTEGLELVRATRTIGRFMKWVILIFLGIVVGVTTFYDNAVKIIGWFRHP